MKHWSILILLLSSLISYSQERINYNITTRYGNGLVSTEIDTLGKESINYYSVPLNLSEIDYSIWDRTEGGKVIIQFTTVDCKIDKIEVLKEFQKLSDFCIVAIKEFYSTIAHEHPNLCSLIEDNLLQSIAIRFELR